MKLKLTGDSDTDVEALLTFLDSASLDAGMSLSRYADYLDDVASAIKDRARQVQAEAESE